MRPIINQLIIASIVLIGFFCSFLIDYNSESALVVYSSYGEGYHNYHHVFPYDYSASELDWRYNFNFTTLFIDTFAKIGWAYDLRRVTPQMMQSRIQRTGDIELHKHTLEQKHKHPNQVKALLLGTSHLWIPIIIRLIW